MLMLGISWNFFEVPPAGIFLESDVEFGKLTESAYVRGMKKIALMALVALVGCTEVRENYESEMSDWVGRSERDLFLHFGAPTQVFEVDASTRIAQYKTDRQELRPALPRPFLVSGEDGHKAWVYLDGPERLVTRRCDLQFVLEGRKSKGQVVDWRYKGNDCFRLR